MTSAWVRRKCTEQPASHICPTDSSKKSLMDGNTWPRRAAGGRPGTSASAIVEDCMVPPFGTRTGSEGALASKAQVGHDGKRQFPVHPASRNATGGSGLGAPACATVGWLEGAAERQAWRASGFSRLDLPCGATPPVCHGRYRWVAPPWGFAHVVLLT